MITIQEKQRLITEHLQVQRILDSLPVKKECVSCEHWDNICKIHNATPPDDVQAKGCDKWKEADFIPFAIALVIGVLNSGVVI